MLHISAGITAYILALTAVLGLCMGSFINCLAWRMTHGESVLHGQSHCTSCGHVLAAKDLVPVFSWLFLKGRCRYCGQKVSARYPATEAICAVAFLSIVVVYDVTPIAGFYLLLVCLLLLVTLTDLDDRIIPNSAIVVGLVARVAYAFTQADVAASLLSALIGAVAISVPLLAIVLVAEKVRGQEMMGGGDIKLLFMMGAWLDWKLDLLLLIASCIIGIIVALATSGGHLDRDKQIPFGPSIALASWLVLLFGAQAVSWYAGLFL